MSRSSDTGATPLNLSLTGLQFSQNKTLNSNRHNQKSLNNSQRSYLSSSSTNILNDSSKKRTSEQKPPQLSSIRSTSNFENDKKAKLPPYLRKDEKLKEENKIKESNIFAPTSSRSSIDEFDLSNKKTEPKKTTKKTGLDLFFSSISNDNIDPVKEENIKKLQDSVDGLRKELKLDSFLSQNDGEFKRNERLAKIRTNLAAISIQKWYKDNRNRRLKHQSEIEKLFNQKKSEMKKKMESSVEKSSFLSKKTSKPVTNQSIRVDKSKKDDSKFIKSSLKNSETDIVKTSVVKQKKSDLFDDTLVAESVKTDTEFLNNNNATVESLLLSLDKLDRESQVSSNNKDVALASQTSEKINSILSFLDEEASKEQNNFIPKQMKDYKFDENFFNDLMKVNLENKKDNKLSVPVTPQRSARKPEKRENIKQVKSDSKLPPKKATDSINITKATTKKTTKSDDEDENEKNTPRNIDNSDKIMNLEMELEEKKRKIASLEKALNQQRELTIRHTHESEREAQLRIEAQKSDYEATIKRHLSFIDQLIDDKKVLSEKCEKLVKELKDSEKNYTDRIRTAEEKFKFETQKLKDTFEAAEKIRREKWIEDKTKKIKEMTVKGLEPEIQSLINKHKNEIKTLKTIHDAELLQADERAAQRYIKITEELRENFEREKEASVQRERDIAKQRYEKSLEEEEKSFLEQRRRLYAEVEEEKNRLAEQASFQRKELDRLRRMLEENNLSTIDTIKKEYTNAQAELEKKHLKELTDLKEKLDIEKQTWEQNYMKKQENWITQKERELKEQVRKDRDKEIELLITRIESESTLAREEADRAADNRIKRIRDKYESELKEVEKSERETMERFNSLKAKFNELEGEHERLKVMYRQKEKDMEGIKKLTDTLQEERNRLADIIRQEFSDRLVFTDEENKRIKLEIAELKSRHQYELDKKKEEIEKIQKEKADELNTVHEKIKQVVSKKDETFNQLKQQYESACKRADHLEGLLEQQRTLMLKKQNNPN